MRAIIMGGGNCVPIVFPLHKNIFSDDDAERV